MRSVAEIKADIAHKQSVVKYAKASDNDLMLTEALEDLECLNLELKCVKLSEEKK